MDPSPVECVGRFLAPWLHPEGEGLGGSFFFFLVKVLQGISQPQAS